MTRRGWVLFVSMCLLWGLPYLLIKVSVRELSPSVLVCSRTLLGALVLLPVAVGRGRLAALRRHWPALLAFTVLEIAAPWLLLARAELVLPSSLTGLLVAGVPLVAAVASRLGGGGDQLDRARLAGLAVGLAGVAALLGLDLGGGSMLPAGEVGLVVLGYGTAPIVVDRYLRDVPSLEVIAVALGLTGLAYLPFALQDLPARLPHARVLLSVVALALVCTVAAFLLFFALIVEVGPNRALVITFVNPAVAVALGITLLHEPFTAGTAVGFPLILAGCLLATRRPRVTVPDPVPVPA